MKSGKAEGGARVLRAVATVTYTGSGGFDIRLLYTLSYGTTLPLKNGCRYGLLCQIVNYKLTTQNNDQN